MKRKLAMIAVILLLCISIGTGAYFMMNDTRVDNVFDEMYRSIHNPRHSQASFHFVRGLGRLTSESDMPNDYWSVYSQPTIPPGEFVTVVVNLDEQIVRVGATIEIENGRSIAYNFLYDVSSKTLTIKPIYIVTHEYYDLGVAQFIEDKDQVLAFLKEHQITPSFVEQYKNYFLYDRVLHDWVTGNGNRSQFSVSEYGAFTIVDNTFAGLEYNDG